MNIINIETVEFIGMLNKLVRLCKGGFIDFADAVGKDCFEKIVIDQSTKYYEYALIVKTCFIDENHHDVVSYYGDGFDNVRVCCEFEDGEPSVHVYVYDKDEIISIFDVFEDGWYNGLD